MKIGILTIHFGRNYGSVLQAMALNRFLSANNNEVTTINYVPKRFNFFSKYYIGQGRNLLLRLVGSTTRFLRNSKQYRIFDNFFDNNVPHTRKIRNEDTLHQICNKYDLLIVGSDQVWNYEYNGNYQKEYFFYNNDVRKISYAASFGNAVDDENYLNEMKTYLERFFKISVREDSGIDVLRNIELEGVVTCDPVFLVEADNWSSFGFGKIPNTKYIFIYALGGKEDRLISFASQLAHKHNLKIALLSFRKISDTRINYQYIYSTPEEFIALIQGAEYIVTNSFHGTSFSIILHKEFFSLRREKNNARIESILILCGIGDRLVNDNTILNDDIKSINYTEVDEKLSAFISKSKKFLMENIYV